MERNLELSADLQNLQKSSCRAFIQSVLIALLVAVMETQELICNSKFAAMVSPPVAPPSSCPTVNDRYLLS